ncbi:hypothetical protein N0V82_000047 [Gnomoniopsis sp. IMI 355080]|nr:hypothetical protein N0V82_000047 [Gnomoniopsis sp. IMI 355080]
MSIKTDHSQRTAHEPRDPSLHKVILGEVAEVNPSIRTFRLDIPGSGPGIKFLPGQWLDVFVPGITKPGGFTITSPPSKAARTTATGAPPYLELAIQKSPENVVASWLWQPIDKILQSDIWIRVGGSFVWPPPGLIPTTLRKLVFIAGGVGINPLMSIISHLTERPDPRYTIDFLYSMRDPGPGARDPAKMLFLNRLAGIFGAEAQVRGDLKLFLTGSDSGNAGEGERDGEIEGLHLPFKKRRITIADIGEAVGEDGRAAAVYICGVPKMTDEFVEKLTSPTGLGMEPRRVLYEKWW